MAKIQLPFLKTFSIQPGVPSVLISSVSTKESVLAALLLFTSL